MTVEGSGSSDGVLIQLSPQQPGGACTWGVSYAECDTLGPEGCWSEAARFTWESIAVDYLNSWTDHAFGLCPIALRPCRTDCYPNVMSNAGYGYGSTFQPVLVAGQWFNLACGQCGDLCSCSGPAAFKLPGPVASITSVTVDGVALPQGAYRVDNAHVLVRTDGGSWPACQEMSLAPTEVGTWVIDYMRGVPVPLGGQVAAGVLAVELAKASCGDTSCQLPRRVQTITRQGVTVALLDAFDDVGKGRTGVWLIDSWLESVNRRPRGGSVRSVDVPSPRHRVTTWPTP